MAEPMTVTLENFQSDVLESDKPVLVDFWAAWCGPCRAVSPVVDEIATENADKLKVGKLNVDEQQQLAMQFGVMSIPTLILFKGGKAVETLVGAQPKARILAQLESHL